ncbi:MAG: hypothetical protein KC561_07860 [Myxococcales bacterium]|nr:hypothetical protein [Myxococcales bacterium]
MKFNAVFSASLLVAAFIVGCGSKEPGDTDPCDLCLANQVCVPIAGGSFQCQDVVDASGDVTTGDADVVEDTGGGETDITVEPDVTEDPQVEVTPEVFEDTSDATADESSSDLSLDQGETPGCGDDFESFSRNGTAFENNNSQGAAAPLGEGITLLDQGCAVPGFGTCDSESVMCDCGSYEDLDICDVSDEDYYAVELVYGDRGTVRVTPASQQLPTTWEVCWLVPNGDGGWTSDGVCSNGDGNARVKDFVATRPQVQTGATGTYLLRVRRQAIVVDPSFYPLEYSVDLQIVNESRECAPDAWDASIEAYDATAASELGCEDSSCGLATHTSTPSSTCDGSDRLCGNLCVWDPQDWVNINVDSTGSLTLRATWPESPGSQGVEFELFDSIGQSVTGGTVTSTSTEYTQSFSVPSGSYSVRVSPAAVEAVKWQLTANLQ